MDCCGSWGGGLNNFKKLARVPFMLSREGEDESLEARGTTLKIIFSIPGFLCALRYLHRQIFNILFCRQNLSTVSSDDVICISGVLF